MPWPVYRDLARHCWDERATRCRQSAFEGEGILIEELPHWIGYGEHQMALDPLERYAHLAIGENHYCRYPPGARWDFEWMRDVGQHALFARYLDYDWADEVLHSQFGRRWVVGHGCDDDVRRAEAIEDMTDQRRREFYGGGEQHPDQLAPAAADVAARSDAT